MAGVQAGGNDSLDQLDKYEQQVYELKYKMLEVKIELLETEVRIARISKDQTNHTIKQSKAYVLRLIHTLKVDTCCLCRYAGPTICILSLMSMCIVYIPLALLVEI